MSPALLLAVGVRSDSSGMKSNDFLSDKSKLGLLITPINEFRV